MILSLIFSVQRKCTGSRLQASGLLGLRAQSPEPPEPGAWSPKPEPVTIVPMRLLFCASVLGLALSAACAAGQEAAPPSATMSHVDDDIHSFARPNVARVTHVALDLTADFAAKTLSGNGDAHAASARPARAEVVLDTRDLTIERVTDADGAALTFALGDADPILRPPAHRAAAGRTSRMIVDRLPHRARPPRRCSGWRRRRRREGATRISTRRGRRF